MAAKRSQEVALACKMLDSLLEQGITKTQAIKLASDAHGVSMATLYVYKRCGLHKKKEKKAREKKPPKEKPPKKKRFCLCGADISNRYGGTKWCLNCQSESHRKRLAK